MASFYSPLVTDLQTAGKRVSARVLGGKMKILPFYYTFLTGGGAAPKVFLTKLPLGYKILNLALS